MKRFLSFFLAIGLIVSMVERASAVDFQAELKKLAQDNARGYITPLATGFGTCMNSGLYHTAKPHGLLGFDISVKIMGAKIPDKDKTFNFIMPDFTVPGNTIPGQSAELILDNHVIYPGSRQTATIFGDSAVTIAPNMAGADSALARAMQGNHRSELEIQAALHSPQWQNAKSNIPTLQTVKGLNLPALPLVMPQVSVGLPFKTEVLVRYVPKVKAGDIGDVKFLGVGVKHSISQWIPMPLLGIDISGQYVWQKLTVGDLIESKHTALNVEVSRRFGFMLLSITPYVGAGTESSNLKISDYTVAGSTNPSIPNGTVIPGFDLKGDNKGRMTFGGRLQLLFFSLNADYSIGAYNTYSVGVGLTLR